MSSLAPVVAHQGGWDEIALFGIPVLIALLAVRLVERRHARKRAEGAPERAEDESAGNATEGPDVG